MALYAIGDLHLSLSSNKPMEIFGDGWRDYVARIREGFSVLTEDDVTVLCGDLSWGMSLEESLEDFRFIDALPGKKYLLKGNHDYWWNTAAKMERFFVSGLPVPGDPAAAAGIRREGVLLRPSPRCFSPPGPAGRPGRNRVLHGLRGLFGLPS